MTDAIEDHEGTVNIGGRTITNLRFADDLDGLAGEEEELANLVERLDKACTAYGMEISTEKTNLVTNNSSGINTKSQASCTWAQLSLMRVPSQALQDSTGNSSIDKAETSLD